MNRHPLARAAAGILGEEITDCTPLQGGDLSDVVRIVTAGGRGLIAKSGPDPVAEGAMLEAMRAAGASAPQPVAMGAEVLVMEDLGPAGGASEACWRDLGESLSRMHGATAERYGWDRDYAFGPVVIRNGWSVDWPDFWMGHRLLADADLLPPDIVEGLHDMRPRIAAALPDAPAAGLLHGDLWTGNVHFDGQGKSWLIDPACYHGHGEVDLAMLTLFGSPPRAFWEAYGPLPDGWERRRAIYQLWPALVHLRLFGGGYRPLVERLMGQVAAG